MKTALNADIKAALEMLGRRPVAHVFLVACGGSLSIMYSGKYFLDRHSSTLTSDIYNADEFVCRDPRKLDARALVILCSQTGTTRRLFELLSTPRPREQRLSALLLITHRHWAVQLMPRCLIRLPTPLAFPSTLPTATMVCSICF